MLLAIKEKREKTFFKQWLNRDVCTAICSSTDTHLLPEGVMFPFQARNPRDVGVFSMC